MTRLVLADVVWRVLCTKRPSFLQYSRFVLFFCFQVTPISIRDLQRPFSGAETAYLLIYRSRCVSSGHECEFVSDRCLLSIHFEPEAAPLCARAVQLIVHYVGLDSALGRQFMKCHVLSCFVSFDLQPCTCTPFSMMISMNTT